MGIVIRQSFWGTAIMYLGIAVGYLNTILIMPMYLDFDQIGLIRLIQSNAALLLPLSILGMGGSLVKYYPEIKKTTDRNRVISLQLVSITFACIVFASLIVIFREYIQSFFNENSANYADYIYISLIILVCQAYYEYLFSISRSELNILVPALLKEVLLRMGSMSLVILFGFGFISFESVIFLLAGFYSLNTFIFLTFIFIKYNFRFDFGFKRIDQDFLKKLVRFAGYSLSLSIGVSVLTNVSFLMTSSYLGLEANGIFTTCFFIGVIIEMPKRAATQIIGPLISRFFADEDMVSVEKIYQSASINLGIISILIALGVFANLQDLFILIPKGDVLEQGAFVVLTIGLSKVVSMFFGPSGEILIYSNYRNTMLYLLLLSAAALIILNAILIPYLGLVGAGLAALISVCIDQLFRFLIIRNQLKIRLFGINHLKLLTLSVCLGLFFYFTEFSLAPLYQIIVRSILISVTFLLGVYFLRISIEYHNFVHFLLKKLLPRKV